MYVLRKTTEFEDWYEEQPLKTKFQIDDRLSRVVRDGHFGTRKDVTEIIWELKWKNGRRIYYAYLAKYELLLLLGGNKNGQTKDISQAEKIFWKYTEEDLSP
jgi:putative addiction module killer protein